jgi:hypothetical protein
MTTVEKLVKRLREECEIDIPEQYDFKRTYAGQIERLRGAWSWFILDGINGHEIVGSQYPARELVRAPRITAAKNRFWAGGIYEVDPS